MITWDLAKMQMQVEIWGRLRLCISNKLPGGISAASLETTL